ncbi:MAG: hypothetical protein COT25_02160 [Candidatus Kerfeldbacteria bacterium CG08_land_8_20_14_0_20_42_7]|uniref:Uncharacterized protein n=1 Tax=Candidatus Kerfeldbacteria bacterium CG08_land_8_20_14_0_20_42_7 TaxID=2014245 RepID=A0A2H0YSY0_9BACT|nr:MAG: hypothetical protein COT25_02160 [Candidatus Kerfeldbacteria bacterium CG08_land_8_20_14_0_20_42_7]
MFHKTLALPNGWTYEDAKIRLLEAQTYAEEHEDLELSVAFADDDGEINQLFVHLEENNTRERIVILTPHTPTKRAEIGFMSDAEFDYHQIFDMIFTLDKHLPFTTPPDPS